MHADMPVTCRFHDDALPFHCGLLRRAPANKASVCATGLPEQVWSCAGVLGMLRRRIRPDFAATQPGTCCDTCASESRWAYQPDGGTKLRHKPTGVAAPRSPAADRLALRKVTAASFPSQTSASGGRYFPARLAGAASRDNQTETAIA